MLLFRALMSTPKLAKRFHQPLTASALPTSPQSWQARSPAATELLKPPFLPCHEDNSSSSSGEPPATGLGTEAKAAAEPTAPLECVLREQLVQLLHQPQAVAHGGDSKLRLEGIVQEAHVRAHPVVGA